MAVDRSNPRGEITSLARAAYQSYAENTPVKTAEEIARALKRDGPTEMITRPVLRDDQLAKTDPDKMTLEEVKRLSDMQARARAAKAGNNLTR